LSAEIKRSREEDFFLNGKKEGKKIKRKLRGAAGFKVSGKGQVQEIIDRYRHVGGTSLRKKLYLKRERNFNLKKKVWGVTRDPEGGESTSPNA